MCSFASWALRSPTVAVGLQRRLNESGGLSDLMVRVMKAALAALLEDEEAERGRGGATTGIWKSHLRRQFQSEEQRRNTWNTHADLGHTPLPVLGIELKLAAVSESGVGR